MNFSGLGKNVISLPKTNGDEALKLCWLPFALRESGLKTKGELKKIASATIYNLEWHIREIRFRVWSSGLSPACYERSDRF
jgi:hypothetical protein